MYHIFNSEVVIDLSVQGFKTIGKARHHSRIESTRSTTVCAKKLILLAGNGVKKISYLLVQPY